MSTPFNKNTKLNVSYDISGSNINPKSCVDKTVIVKYLCFIKSPLFVLCKVRDGSYSKLRLTLSC